MAQDTDWATARITIQCDVPEIGSCELVISPFDEIDDVLDDLAGKFKNTALQGLARNRPEDALPDCLPFRDHNERDRYYAIMDPLPVRMKFRFLVESAVPQMKIVPVGHRTRFSGVVAAWPEYSADLAAGPPGRPVAADFGGKKVRLSDRILDSDGNPKGVIDFRVEYGHELPEIRKHSVFRLSVGRRQKT
jgi:hypothetical protein